MGEYGHPRNHYKETWQRLDPGERTVALELLPNDASSSQAGYWVFSGDWFVRAVGLRRGTGLVASQCAPNLAAVREYHGLEKVNKELEDCWVGAYGRVKPGHLECWAEGKPNGVFLDVTEGISVQRENGLVVVSAKSWKPLQAGPASWLFAEERWRILEM